MEELWFWLIYLRGWGTPVIFALQLKMTELACEDDDYMCIGLTCAHYKFLFGIPLLLFEISNNRS